MNIPDGYEIYPESAVQAGENGFALVTRSADRARFLAVSGPADDFQEASGSAGDVRLFPLTPANLAALRQRLPWLRPQALGLQTTAGFGDRLGLATPGHIRAVRGTGIAPIFAQQSVRENARTHRTPQQVMDDAAWGVFQCGWSEPWGADADHLKTTADIDSFFDAGFTFFTIDPGEHVDNAAQTGSLSGLREKVQALPWAALRSSPEESYRRYLGRELSAGSLRLEFDEEALLRALAKYGRAVAHTLRMATHLAQRAGGRPYDLEISVDETETPTSAAEHFLVASELMRLGVRWHSMAPRFVGRFEKGVDYIGDLEAFTRTFAEHAAIARAFHERGSGYRLSLHSGSDKFSIYGIAYGQAGGLLHLKTAGTSYLEGLRVIAQADETLFRAILALAVERYETDRASYHVSAQLEKVRIPGPGESAALAALLDQFDARQVFHVTFGAALERFGAQIYAALHQHEEAYAQALAAHFQKHLAPFQP